MQWWKIKIYFKKEGSGMLSRLGLKTPLSKVILLGGILFSRQFHWTQIWMKYEWNHKQVLLAGDKFIPGMHLK